MFETIIKYREIDSTNTESFRIADKINENSFVVIAEKQTAGKGRNLHKWFSPERENIYTSFVVKDSPLSIFDENIIATLSVIDTLKKYGITACIKLPNDIIVDNRKIAGILIEEKFLNQKKLLSVIGIGLNVNTNFDDIGLLKDTGISMAMVKKRKFNLNEVFNILHQKMRTNYINYNLNALFLKWQKNLLKPVKVKININGAIKVLKIKDILPRGEIITSEGKFRYEDLL